MSNFNEMIGHNAIFTTAEGFKIEVEILEVRHYLDEDQALITPTNSDFSIQKWTDVGRLYL